MNTKLTILSLLALFLISCGGGGSSSSSSNNQTLITEIIITGNTFILSGTTTTLSATITPGDATNQNLNWSSSNEEVATVNNNGLVTALRVGTTTITATATDGSGVTASTKITATPIYITSINLAGNNTITVGDATTLTATITPNDATNQEINWSSSNEEVATVNNNGLVIALTVGTSTITATATDGSGVTASTKITATPIYITSINLAGKDIITVGDETTLSATITPNDATNQNLTWSSSDEAVATVTNGLVAALNSGTATITATATDGSGITAAFTIITGKAPTINNTAFQININAAVDTILGNLNIKNNPESLRILEHPDGDHNYFSIDNDNNLVLTNELTTTKTSIIEITAANQFGTTNENITINITTNQIAKLLPFDTAITIQHGHAVAMDSQYIVVTDLISNIFVYKINNDNTISELQQISSIGDAVAIHNNYIIVGSSLANNDKGRATLFTIDPQTDAITQSAVIEATDGANNDRFGFSVALNNNTILIGAPGNIDLGESNINGYAYLFNINTQTNTVSQTAKLLAADGGGNDQFGVAVALNNNYALIGAELHNHSSLADNGAAYLFDITDITPNTTITHTTKLVANDGGGGDSFGTSVALNNDYALIGAYLHDHSNLTRNGAAYLFAITDITPNTIITHTTKLVANDDSDYDYFGGSVALNNNYALIGAYLHDHSGLFDNGAAYLFDITDITPNTTITHTTKLVANDGEGGDSFGASVALNNNYALIGAPHQDIVNNDGFTYVFDL